MATQETLHSFQALRAQILDNFSIAMPDQLKTKVVLAHCEDTWWCIIYGNDSKPIWKTAKGCDTAELALRKMLVSSSDLLFDKFHKDGFVLDGQVDGSSGKTKVFKTHISKQRWEARNVAVTFPDQLPTASSDCCKTRSCPRVRNIACCFR